MGHATFTWGPPGRAVARAGILGLTCAAIAVTSCSGAASASVRTPVAAPPAGLSPATRAVGAPTSAGTPGPALPVASPSPTVAGPALPLLLFEPPRALAAPNLDVALDTYQGEVCGIYPNPACGYFLRFPKVWTAAPDGCTVWLLDHTRDDQVIGVASRMVAPDGIDLEAALERSLAAAIAGHGGRLAATSTEPARLGNLAGVRVNYTYRSTNDERVSGVVAAATSGTYLYKIEIRAPTEDLERWKQAIALTIAGFSLTSAE